MNFILNIDILSVGIAVAANIILGVIVFYNDRKSATNILFLLQTIILSVWSIFNYITYHIKKYLKANGIDRQQLKYLLWGVIIMFFFILLFNFVFPILFQSSRFIPLSAVFTFPFVIFTFYAIYRHKLFNIQNLATVIVAF